MNKDVWGAFFAVIALCAAIATCFAVWYPIIKNWLF